MIVTYIYFKVKLWVILTHNQKVWCKNMKYSSKDICQKYQTVKYGSLWPTFILRSELGPYWLIIQKYYVYTSNTFQAFRQNHWTMKYRSLWPTFILRWNFRSYWLFKIYVYIWNTLQDILQNHCTFMLTLTYCPTSQYHKVDLCLKSRRKKQQHFLQVS